MTMDRLCRSLLLLLLALPVAAACGDDDDDDDRDHDDDGDGTLSDAGTPDAAVTPDGGPVPDAAPGDGGPPDAAVPDAGPEIDAAPPGPGLIWIHGDMITNGRDQLAAVPVGLAPAEPVVVLPAGEAGSLATFQSVNSGAYDISANGRRVALPADIDSPTRYDLWAGSVDGTNMVRLFTASGFTQVGKARFSPNGARIAFTADIDLNGVFAAYVVDSTVPDATPLRVSPVDGADDVDDLVWSSDSRFIMVTGDFTEADHFELYVTDVTAASPSPVRLISRADIQTTTTASAGVLQPIQARDGQILFKGRIAADDAIRLHRVPLAGGAITVLPQSEIPRVGGGTGIADYGSIGLSPDGNQIAFAADETPGIYDLWAMPVSGSEPPTRLTAGLVAPAPPAVIRPDPGQPLRWSPDGQQVAFTADYVTLRKDDAFVALLDGSGHRRVVDVGGGADPNADVESLGWSPDGTQLYMVADQQTPNQVELFVLDPTLTDQTPTLVLGVPTGGNLRGDITVSN